jgi:ion channel
MQRPRPRIVWYRFVRQHGGSVAPPASIQSVAGIDMLRQLIVGSGVSICNIVIHALVMTAVVRVARTVGAKKMAYPAILLICVMVATVSVLMAAHMLEVLVWALAYAIVDAAPAGADLVYFALVNYTTLGYGDVIPMARWRLLGPMTAMNGVLLFGWSTAVIFQVLRKTMLSDARDT